MSWAEFVAHPNFPLWVLSAGLLFAALAGFLFWRKLCFFRGSAIAIAHNVAFEKRSAMEGNVWHTTVEFSDTQGKTYQLGYTGSGPYPPFAKMKNLKVYYDPHNPKKAYAYAFWKVWVRELALISVALLLIVIGAANMINAERERTEQAYAKDILG